MVFGNRKDEYLMKFFHGTITDHFANAYLSLANCTGKNYYMVTDKSVSVTRSTGQDALLKSAETVLYQHGWLADRYALPVLMPGGKEMCIITEFTVKATGTAFSRLNFGVALGQISENTSMKFLYPQVTIGASPADDIAYVIKQSDVTANWEDDMYNGVTGSGFFHKSAVIDAPTASNKWMNIAIHLYISHDTDWVLRAQVHVNGGMCHDEDMIFRMDTGDLSILTDGIRPFIGLGSLLSFINVRSIMVMIR